METLDHRALKRLALSFARAMGCCAAATEVVAPVPRHRVDVAGYGDGPSRFSCDAGGIGGGGQPGGSPVPARDSRRRPFTVLIECKQSRADFLRDTRDRDALLRRRRAVERQLRDVTDTLLPACEPHLMLGAGAPGAPGAPVQPPLFPQLASWDIARSALPACRELLREIARIDRQVYGGTKFFCLATWRLADYLYIAAPRGMIAPHELPTGWGLVEFTRPGRAGGHGARAIAPLGAASDDACAAPPLPDIRIACEPVACDERRRVRLLRNIAVKASRPAFLSRPAGSTSNQG